LQTTFNAYYQPHKTIYDNISREIKTIFGNLYAIERHKIQGRFKIAPEFYVEEPLCCSFLEMPTYC
jgi:hypothetical protein